MKTSEYYRLNIKNRCKRCRKILLPAWKNCDNKECKRKHMKSIKNKYFKKIVAHKIKGMVRNTITKPYTTIEYKKMLIKKIDEFINEM